MQNQLTFYRGDTVNINITVKADLTGSTLFFTMKTVPDNDLTDTSALIKSTVTTHTDPVNGKSVIQLTPTDTNNATPGPYVYDVQLKDSLGNISTLLSGKVKVLADVTRRSS